MFYSIDGLLIIAGVLSGLILFCIGLILFFKFSLHYRKKQNLRLTQIMLKFFSPDNRPEVEQYVQKNPKQALRVLLELSQNQKLHKDKHKELIELVRNTGITDYYQRRLQSGSSRKRMDAVVHLTALPGGTTNDILKQALRVETNRLVRLYLCDALATVEEVEAIPLMVETLPGAPQWYRTRVNMMLTSFGVNFYQFLPAIIGRDDVEIRSLIIDFAAQYPAEELKQYLLAQVNDQEKDLAYRATRTLGVFYYHELNCSSFLAHTDPVLRNIAILALDKIPTRQTIENLLPLLSDSKSGDQAATVISQITQREPRHLPWLIELFDTHPDQAARRGLAKVLSNRIDYLLMHLLVGDGKKIRHILADILKMGQTNGVIGFLGRNKTIELENAILSILLPLMEESNDLRQECRLYLPERILAKMQETPLQQPQAERVQLEEKGKLIRLQILLLLAFGLVPVLYLIRHWENLAAWSMYAHLTQFVLDFNYFIAFYSITVSSSYIILLVCSLYALIRQAKRWRLKKNAFLFRPRILPGISIIAPAYQEEASIIESATSLLSLHYPNYEVIIVNDGSTDNTLRNLIQHFKLEKVDRFIPGRLQTKPVRGIYASRDIPKLVVIDKANGGKADALNVGINTSQKEFVCGIDADSLLEKDSLIKLASLVPDSKDEPIAVGGNIFPVNGCTVDKGTLAKINIPRGHLARFQTIEYLRAFMAGRLGWAQLRSLLIISGAFGLFNKDRVVEVGGYLTSSERFKQDTVGEDMELVVRLNRHMLEQKLPFSILYAFNANCWTEVPVSLPVLYRQRDRWQRGLIDILYFHRAMQINPRYGRIGLVSMPYFFMFELLGPFLEIQGYIMVVLAFFLGLLDANLALLLFVSTILLGMLVSIFALAIAGKENDYFPGPYVITMLLYAFLENFGVRQMISFWRVMGFFSALRQTVEWGNMEKKGFKPKPDAEVRAGAS